MFILNMDLSAIILAVAHVRFGSPKTHAWLKLEADVDATFHSLACQIRISGAATAHLVTLVWLQNSWD